MGRAHYRRGEGMTPDWIAVDWGTSRLRAWAMGADNAVLDHAASGDGMARLDRAGFEPALLRLVGPWLAGGRRTDVVACGMVGARQGWVEAPYRAVPCDPLDPHGATVAPAADPRMTVRILPGLSQADPPDVMRGEETQIAGFLGTEPDFDGLLCLPGTHTKWVTLRAGRVEGFRTAMTGELFDLLSGHSVLRHSLDGGWDDAAFAEAVALTRNEPARLATELFAIRAASLLGTPAPGAACARLSGLLIGAEIAALGPPRDVAVIGTEGAARHYATALTAAGFRTTGHDATGITLAGLIRARGAMKDTQ